MKVKHILGALALIILTLLLTQCLRSQDTGPTDLPVTRTAGKEADYTLISRIGVLDGSKVLNQPSYAVSDNRGKVYIADSGNHRVVVCDYSGKVLNLIGTASSVKPLVYPYGIVVMSNRVIVADSGSGTVEEYNTDGEYIKTWDKPAEKSQPGMLCLGMDGRILAGDLLEREVLIYNKQGQLQKQLKPQKVALGIPHGLADTGDGGLWVVDGENSNVKLLDAQGETVSVLDGGAQLITPKGLARDSAGRLFISDVLSNTVRIFDQTGRALGLLKGTSRETFALPLGISIDKTGRILVADQGGNEIQIWGQRR